MTTDTVLQSTDPVVDTLCPDFSLHIGSDDTRLDCDGNTLRSEQFFAIAIGGSRGTVTNCIVNCINPITGILDAGDFNRFVGNTVTGCGYGVRLQGGGNATILDNDLVDNRVGIEIHPFGPSEGNLLARNRIENNLAGINLAVTGNNVILDNDVLSSGNWGLLAGSGFGKNRIIWNRFNHNGGDGLLSFDAGNLVLHNEMNHNGGDGLLFFSAGNLVLHNEMNHNGLYGISDNGTGSNVYKDNECANNVLGPSDPPGLCDEKGDDDERQRRR